MGRDVLASITHKHNMERDVLAYITHPQLMR
jgi:hypothetical protein